MEWEASLGEKQDAHEFLDLILREIKREAQSFR